MKKIILFLFLATICFVGFSQSSYREGKIINNVKYLPGTYRVEIYIPQLSSTTNARIDWHWQIWAEYKDHVDTTAGSYIQVQQSGTDNTGVAKWANYAGLSADSMKTISSTPTASVFEDPFGFCGRKLALKIYVAANDSLYLSAWYTLIK